MTNSEHTSEAAQHQPPAPPGLSELRRSVTARLDEVRPSMPDEEFMQLVNCVTWLERYK